MLFITYNADAIVIRHDVDDKEYRELGEQYSASIANFTEVGCVTTLINPEWLLTAAHCVTKEGSIRGLTEVAHLGDKYVIEHIIAHPQYDATKSLDHDIALVHLKQPIVKGSPVGLYKQKNEQGKPVVFVGNGYSGNGREGITERNFELRGATNTIAGVSEQAIKFKFDKPRTGSRLEGISGPGDSGGPAFITIDSQIYVVGVSSHQKRGFKKEAHYGVKEVYTRVSTHYSWIESVVNQ